MQVAYRKLKYKTVTKARVKHEMGANTRETRDGIGLVSYAGFLGSSLVILATIHFLYVRRSLKSQIITTSYFSISRSFKVIDVGTTGKLVSSACYDKQQVCVYLQPFSC